MTPIIIENFLPDPVQTGLERALLHHNFPWFFYANTNAGDAITRGDDVPQFVHGFIQDGRSLSDFSDIAQSVVQPLGLSDSDILRAKANILARESVPMVHPRHIDEPSPHLVMIYYVNDADGDTCLFQGQDILHRITPKRGRAVIFDGRTHHASSSPVKARFRVVMNFNLRADIPLSVFDRFRV